MAQTFAYEFSTPGTPEAVAARLQPAITERLRRPTGGSAASNAQRQLRLSSQTETSLSYKPKLLAPLPVSTVVWARRLLAREKVDVQFAPDESGGQTRISVSGTVGRGTQAVADHDFWAELVSSGSEPDS